MGPPSAEVSGGKMQIRSLANHRQTPNRRPMSFYVMYLLYNHKMKRIGIVFSILLVCGCSSILDQSHSTTMLSNTPLTSPHHTNTNEVASTRTPSISSNPDKTITVSPTNTPTTLPTWTALPTVANQNDLLESFSFTLADNCELPCWAGITPGETTWEKLIHLTKPMSNVVKLDIETGLINSPMGNESEIDLYFSNDTIGVKGNIFANRINEQLKVQSIILSLYTQVSNPNGLDSTIPQHLSMKELIKEYGPPEMVFLNTDLGVPEYPEVNLSLLLVYPEYRFIIHYPRRGKVDGEELTSCKPSDHFILTVFDNKEDLNSKKAISQIPETQSLKIEYWWEFNEVADTSISDYFNDFISSEADCLSFPIDEWRFMLGE
jgi:hypothetical protein